MAEHRVPPHDLKAESSLLGAMMLSNDAIERSYRIVTAADFYKPSHQNVFMAVIDLWRDGSAVDPVTVAEIMKSRNQLEQLGGAAELLSLITHTPATSAAPRYAEIIVNKSMLRRAISIGNELIGRAYDDPQAPQDLMEKAATALLESQVSVRDMPDGVWRLDDFLDQPPEDKPEWIIPGMIRKGWRIMLVAAEGAGKTTLFRQIAICTAQGIHPLHHQNIEPKRCLIVDCENPQDSIVDVCEPIRSEARSRSTDYDVDRPWLWWKPEGINLRTRGDRIRLESVIQNTRPDLVAIGPVYKIYNVTAHENDELAAGEVMSVLDDLRTRYKFGLMMEHHAPKGVGSKRDMMPFGTSLWLRWPEMGLSMQPIDQNDDTNMKIGRWRGDRLRNEWPESIYHGKTWPWAGRWPTGTFSTREPQGPDEHDREDDHNPSGDGHELFEGDVEIPPF